MKPVPVRAILAIALVVLPPPPAAFPSESPHLVVNGDFEAKDEGGWFYLGQRDGSHGVFSEPSRPGTHSYLLQLAGDAGSGFSAISQVLNLRKGAVYQLRLDVWNQAVDPKPGAEGSQSGILGRATAFDRDLCQPGASSGWTSLAMLIRPEEDHPALQMRVTGAGLDREASTTVIDQVSLIEIAARVHPALLPGKPLLLPPPRKKVFLGLGYAGISPSLLSLQDFRDRFEETPALATVQYAWHHTARAPLWPGLTAWAQQGVVPILALAWFPDDLACFPEAETQQRWRQFAEQARRWRYPLILRLAPEMDREFPASQASDFVSCWNAIHRIFEEADARNVRWFWTPSRLGDASHSFFPGNGSVDLVGFPVRGPLPAQTIRANLDEARRRYPGKALAVAGSSGFPPAPELWRRSAPALEFFTLGDLTEALPAAGSDACPGIARVLKHPSVAPSIPQVQPPELEAKLSRDGPRLTISLINRSPPAATPPSRCRLEIWNGHPYREGTLLEQHESIAIRPSQRRTLRLTLPPEAMNSAHVLVDRAADPLFLQPHPDDWDWKSDPDLILLPVPQD